MKNENDFIKLWLHESERVFKDRLINESDRNLYDDMLSSIMKDFLKRDYINFTKEGNILFGDFVPTISSEKDLKIFIREQYCEICDKNKLKIKLEDTLAEHIVEKQLKAESSLVLFPYAIDHIVRIARTISTPNGHALLVGVGGSGRRSLTNLAGFLYSYNVTNY